MYISSSGLKIWCKPSLNCINGMLFTQCIVLPFSENKILLSGQTTHNRQHKQIQTHKHKHQHKQENDDNENDCLSKIKK